MGSTGTRHSSFIKILRAISLLLFVLAVCEVCAFAEIYKYVDSAGTVHFVDDAGKIPKQFLNKRQVYNDETLPKPVGTVTNIKVIGNQVLVPVTLHYNGKRVTALLLLDTGATTTSITPEVAQDLGVNFSSGKLAVGQVAGGGLLAVMTVTLDKIDVGSRSRTEVDVDIIRHEGPPVEFDGLLGMNYLRNYRYTIDCDNGVIKWEE